MISIESQSSVVPYAWLALNIENPRLLLLDASMKSGSVAGASVNNSSEVRLPKTKVFDFERRFSDRGSSLPHMMPTPELFEQEARSLGIKRDSIIVVYDRTGVYASPRAWWMFKAMGHDNVVVLDGGMPAWIEAGLPVEPDADESTERGDFVARPRKTLICDADHVARALEDQNCAVVDARSEGRFYGREPEPRPGLRSGHIPNSINLPYTSVLQRGQMRSATELQALFASKIGDRRNLVFTCGSGVTACILALAATIAGYSGISVYDGSWSEWGLPSGRPIASV